MEVTPGPKERFLEHDSKEADTGFLTNKILSALGLIPAPQVRFNAQSAFLESRCLIKKPPNQPKMRECLTLRPSISRIHSNFSTWRDFRGKQAPAATKLHIYKSQALHPAKSQERFICFQVLKTPQIPFQSFFPANTPFKITQKRVMCR